MSLRATSIRVDNEMIARVDRVADLLSRTRSWVIAQAIQQFLDYEEWVIEAIQEGIEAADKGQVVDHERVRAWVESWQTPNELDQPKCE